jgi:putative membrane protein
MKMIRSIALMMSLGTAAAAAVADHAGPTDPQIASIVVTANQVDIDAGKLAAHSQRGRYANRAVPAGAKPAGT